MRLGLRLRLYLGIVFRFEIGFAFILCVYCVFSVCCCERVNGTLCHRGKSLLLSGQGVSAQAKGGLGSSGGLESSEDKERRVRLTFGELRGT